MQQVNTVKDIFYLIIIVYIAFVLLLLFTGKRWHKRKVRIRPMPERGNDNAIFEAVEEARRDFN